MRFPFLGKPKKNASNGLNLTKSISGKNNSISLGTNVTGRLKIMISGDDNSVNIGEDVVFPGYTVINIRGSRCSFRIGKGSSSQGCVFHLVEPETSIEIGSNCVIANQTQFFTGDFHQIVDIETGQKLNHGKDITIADHVWIGLRAIILKGTSIGEHSVIAAGAIVSGDIPTEVIAGGIPAKVLRKNVTWRA